MTYKPKDTLNLYGAEEPTLGPVRSSVKLHHAPGGKSQVALGHELEPAVTAPLTPVKKRPEHDPPQQPSGNASLASPGMAGVFGSNNPPTRSSIRLHHAPGGASEMAQLFSQQDDDDVQSSRFRTNRSNFSHNVFNLSPAVIRNTRGAIVNANRESISDEACPQETQRKHVQNPSDESTFENSVPTAPSFRTGRGNASKLNFGDQEPPRTSVKVHHAPGGRSSGNIISWS